MQLTNKESQIIFDTEFLINKISAINKIQKIFEEVRKSLFDVLNSADFTFPKYVDDQLGKIFKGENYQSLPYVNLDFPKYYSNKNAFTFRTMFWWGNFFSSTLHLQGKSLDLLRKNIFNNLDKHLNDEIYICINKSPWEYHYNSDNYILLSDFNLSKFDELPFLKLSKKFDLADYYNLPILSAEFLKMVLSILKS